MTTTIRGTIVAATLLLSATTSNAATTVLSGFDFLFTPSGPDTYIEFALPGGGTYKFYKESNAEDLGKPLCGANSYDFNDGNGCTAVQDTDTILHRTQDAVLVDGTSETVSDTINLEMVALSLISSQALDVTAFGGAASEFVEARVLKDLTTGTWVYGEDLGSTMTISQEYDANGDIISRTFDSALYFAVDLFGAVSGYLDTVIFSMTQTGAPWQDTPFPNSTIDLIDGVNHLMNGVDETGDFFAGPANHCDENILGISGCHATVPPQPVPVPAPLLLLGGAVGILGAFRLKSVGAAA